MMLDFVIGGLGKERSWPVNSLLDGHWSTYEKRSGSPVVKKTNTNKNDRFVTVDICPYVTWMLRHRDIIDILDSVLARYPLII